MGGEFSHHHHAPACFKNLIVIKISIGEMRNHSFIFKYEVVREKTGGRLPVGRRRAILAPFPTMNYSQLGSG